MAQYGEEDAMKLIEEMTRFEAEIATNSQLPVAGMQPPRPIIGANTFDIMQKKLENVGKAKLDGMGPDALGLGVPPPPPLGFAGLVPPVQAAFAGIPPPPPPPPFMVPQAVRAQRSLTPLNRVPPPPPPSLTSGFRPKAVPAKPPAAKPPAVVLSAAPTKYVKNEVPNYMDEELNNFLSEIKKEEEEFERTKRIKIGAKAMSDNVRASTVVSIQPINFDDSGGSNQGKSKKQGKNKKLVRMAGGQAWEDPSLLEWEEDDFRIFCGDLGNDVTDEVLTRAFNKYSSFLKARVIRDKRTNKTKGFGFVSFKDPQDFIKAMKEMNGRYVGSRPIKLRKSTWKSRSMETVKKKEKEKAVLINLLTGR